VETQHHNLYKVNVTVLYENCPTRNWHNCYRFLISVSNSKYALHLYEINMNLTDKHIQQNKATQWITNTKTDSRYPTLSVVTRVNLCRIRCAITLDNTRQILTLTTMYPCCTVWNCTNDMQTMRLSKLLQLFPQESDTGMQRNALGQAVWWQACYRLSQKFYHTHNTKPDPSLPERKSSIPILIRISLMLNTNDELGSKDNH
jgi:hypothetical protein